MPHNLSWNPRRCSLLHSSGRECEFEARSSSIIFQLMIGFKSFTSDATEPIDESTTNPVNR
jgi:hypothetical protein